ncbi:hypothetical protein V757_12680 [Pelistega indica]|uniref:Uncharacterized protein n=1 Tax=Pelistega indica TaxID=1414851 RepID=V8FRS9_9BURK|nr:GTPase domain-containing protein [Pelistega indica]ETD66418.1 hypothetical protein V757_12680 [Pelistega indica]
MPNNKISSFFDEELQNNTEVINQDSTGDPVSDINSLDNHDIDVEVPSISEVTSNTVHYDNDDYQYFDDIGVSKDNIRDLKRQAQIKMTPDEYRNRLTELNERAENKHFVMLFGTPSSGKSYVIASLLHYMNSYLPGNVRLNPERTTKQDSLIFNTMQEMFSNPRKRIGRTGTLDFYELNVLYEPEELNKPEVEITFIDASGENMIRMFDGDTERYAGELPDSLEVILDSRVNCKFIFVYDQSQRRLEREHKELAPQVMILQALYNRVLELQKKNKKRYPKILLLSKSDKISQEERMKYGESPQAYALSDDNELKSFAKGFFTEANSPNKTIFYKIGTFTKHDDLDVFDEECPKRLFDWLYSSITGRTASKQVSWWRRFVNWLVGKS